MIIHCYFKQILVNRPYVGGKNTGNFTDINITYRQPQSPFLNPRVSACKLCSANDRHTTHRASQPLVLSPPRDGLAAVALVTRAGAHVSHGPFPPLCPAREARPLPSRLHLLIGSERRMPSTRSIQYKYEITATHAGNFPAKSNFSYPFHFHHHTRVSASNKRQRNEYADLSHTMENLITDVGFSQTPSRPNESVLPRFYGTSLHAQEFYPGSCNGSCFPKAKEIVYFIFPQQIQFMAKECIS